MAIKKPQSVEVPVDGPVMMPSTTSIPDPGPAPIPALPPAANATQGDEIPGIVMGAMKEAQTPSLAPQGPSNPILKLFSRAAGQSADTPAPGKPYEGPTTGSEKRANLGKYIGGLQEGLAEAAAPFGTPEQKTYAMELPEKRRELQASNDLKNATLNATTSFHQGQLANTADKNDIARQKDIGAMRIKGYIPDESGAGYRPMSEDEILSDPFLSKNRDLSTAALNYKKAQADLQGAKRDALMNPNSLTQQNKLRELDIKAKQADGYLAMARQRLNLAQGTQQISAYNAMMNTGQNPLTNETLADAQARGAAPRTLADAQGNPVPYKQMSVFSPTMQMKNIAAQAQVAAQGIPGVMKELDELGDSLGPVAGRWNDFMQGRVGLDNPSFAGLRSDLLMLSSAVALAHARGRLPENLREEFDTMINAPQQDPANIKAVLQHILPWMKKVAAMPSQPVPVPPMTGGDGNVIEYERGADGKLHPKKSTATVH